MVRRLFLTVAACVTFAGCGGTPPVEGAPATVVEAFNQAVTRQDAEAALAHLADGGVQYQLRSSHADMGESTGLTADLNGQWTVVTSLLFQSLESYARTVEVTEESERGEIATVWTTTRTESLEKGASSPSVLEFSEVYLLLEVDGTWKIAGMANNRPTT